ncbi:DUF4180 domain-containing protein [Achromobacter aloeverae]|uniref:DUF4180 domain-containing protein n=1 Tax=Achromobacter aloeverae TaxID=1750518 RepID=UPI001F018C6C|nr:DUF4180 domain-containing protein [Achromobacter aloeverae]
MTDHAVETPASPESRGAGVSPAHAACPVPRVLAWHAPAASLRREDDALDLIVAARAQDAEWIAVDVATLHEDFFRLHTGAAGAIAQKLVNYGFKLAVVGDIEPWLADSVALRAYVRESNRGGHVRFVATVDALRR